jgi:hypothetical protein
MPTRPFFRPPLQPDRDAIARRNKMLADTHEIIRQTTQSIEEVRELLHRIELVVRRRLGTPEENGEDPPLPPVAFEGPEMVKSQADLVSGPARVRSDSQLRSLLAGSRR